MPTVNGVTGSSQQTATSLPGKTLGKDEFLSLLIAQLKQQDPLSPMQNTEFISQMAQLTSLEQLQELNEGLGRLLSIQEQNAGRQDLIFASSLLGREIEARDPATGATYKEEVHGYFVKDGQIWFSCEEHEIPAAWVFKTTVLEQAEQTPAVDEPENQGEAND